MPHGPLFAHMSSDTGVDVLDAVIIAVIVIAVVWYIAKSAFAPKRVAKQGLAALKANSKGCHVAGSESLTGLHLNLVLIFS